MVKLRLGFHFIFQVIWRSSWSDFVFQFLILLSFAAQKLKKYSIKFLVLSFPWLTYHRYAHDCDSDRSTWYGLRLYRESAELDSCISKLFDINFIKTRSFIALTLKVSFVGSAISRFDVQQWVFDSLWWMDVQGRPSYNILVDSARS